MLCIIPLLPRLVGRVDPSRLRDTGYPTPLGDPSKARGPDTCQVALLPSPPKYLLLRPRLGGKARHCEPVILSLPAPRSARGSKDERRNLSLVTPAKAGTILRNNGFASSAVKKNTAIRHCESP